MRAHIRTVIYACLFVYICLSTTRSVKAEDDRKAECSAHFTGKYNENTCKVTIDRDNPATPLPVTVPRGTKVLVVIIHARPLEKITYDESVSRIDKPDVGYVFANNILDPLKAIVASNAVREVNENLKITPGNDKTTQTTQKIDSDRIFKQQEALEAKLITARKQIETVTIELGCIASYKEVAIDKASCSTHPLDENTYSRSVSTAINDIEASIVHPSTTNANAPSVLPTAEITALSSYIKKQFSTYGDDGTPLPECTDHTAIPDCAAEQFNKLLNNQAQLESQLKDLQDAQGVLLKARAILEAEPSPKTNEITRKQGKDSTSTIKITATEQLQQTATDLGTVTITWQNNPWLVSTGALFSSLANNTFSVAPTIKDGVPSVNDDGDPLSQIAESTNKPAVVLPLVMANYRVASSKKCGLQCGLYLSGGAGLNIGPNEANFAAGISFRYGGVLLSPLAHIGREAHLSSGLKVGQSLGANPPSSLPTASDWKVAFGIGISYILPFK